MNKPTRKKIQLENTIKWCISLCQNEYFIHKDITQYNKLDYALKVACNITNIEYPSKVADRLKAKILQQLKESTS